MSKEKYQKTWFVFLVAMICCVLWGSAFPCIKLGYRMCQISNSSWQSQLLYAGLRFMLAGFLVIVFACISERSVQVPKIKNLGKILHLSLYQTILQYLCFYVGLAHTAGSKAAIIIGANVFVAYLVSSVFCKLEVFQTKKFVGCFLGFLGVAFVNFSSDVSLHFSWNGEGLIFMATVAYALSSVCLKRYAGIESTAVLSGYQFLLGGIVLTIISIIGGALKQNFVVSTSGMLMLLYLALVSAVAYTLWAFLLKYNSVSKVTIFGCMNPICGVLLSYILLKGEAQLALGQAALALVFVLAGMWLVNGSKGK